VNYQTVLSTAVVSTNFIYEGHALYRMWPRGFRAFIKLCIAFVVPVSPAGYALNMHTCTQHMLQARQP